jgi:hypothetical protein
MARTRRWPWFVGVAVLAVIGLALGLGGGGGGGSDASGGSSAGANVAGPKDAASGGVGRAAATSTSAVGVSDSAGSLGASRVVRTGNLELTVAAASVVPTANRLATLATSSGGYVQSSRTARSPQGTTATMVLRVPGDEFEAALTAAERLGGHVRSVSSTAHDVTGRFVDLGARRSALLRTRSTYLTIESQARTVGATLAVQQHVEDVQSQIDELTGELQLLRHQSDDATLAVDVEPSGDTLAVHHHTGGIGTAWHRSWSRFARGFDDLVGVIGPLVLALLVAAVLAAIGLVGYRGVRRVGG